jgi:hypothetical protein
VSEECELQNDCALRLSVYKRVVHNPSFQKTSWYLEKEALTSAGRQNHYKRRFSLQDCPHSKLLRCGSKRGLRLAQYLLHTISASIYK